MIDSAGYIRSELEVAFNESGANLSHGQSSQDKKPFPPP